MLVSKKNGVTDLAAECHVEDRRPCDISVSVGYARDLARDAGVPAPEIDKLLQSGYRDEAEVRRALESARDRLKGQQRKEATAVISYLWPSPAAAAKRR